MLYKNKFKKTAPTPFSQGIHHEFIFKPSQPSSGKFQAFYFLSVNWVGFGIVEDIFAWLTTVFTLTCYIDLWWHPCSVPIQYSAESILCLSLVPLFLPGLGSIDLSISSFEQLANGCLGNKLPRIHKSWAWCVRNPSIWGVEVGV